MAAGNLWDWACEFWLILRSWGSVSGYASQGGSEDRLLALWVSCSHSFLTAASHLCVAGARKSPAWNDGSVFGDREIVCNGKTSNF